ncbi:MAG: hypothetical protein V4850_29630 [Myxococcota bacterium]
MLFLLVACAPDAPCPDGATRRDDGLCYVEAVARGPTADEVVAALPACTLDAAEGNGRLDLDGHCVDGACAGDSYADMNAGVGEEGYCDGGALFVDGSTEPYAHAEWSPGFWTYFPAIEGTVEPYDYAPDPDVPTGSPIHTYDGYTGTTAEGLGVGSPLSCWVDTLGVPEILEFQWEDGEPALFGAWWQERGVSLYYLDTEPVLELEAR